jgi:hypothetical protein
MILEKSQYYANATINILERANMIFQVAALRDKKRGRDGDEQKKYEQERERQ